MSLKTLREDLARHQSDPVIQATPAIVHDIDNLVRLIDYHRPLGSDGTHGDQHTPHCGCEDVRRCRVCGCTDNNACLTLGQPCRWFEPDLCSACLGKSVPA
jgi:hypothetical protein